MLDCDVFFLCGVLISTSSQASFQSWKIKGEVFKGGISSVGVLPLNKLLLLAGDSGQIALVSWKRNFDIYSSHNLCLLSQNTCYFIVSLLSRNYCSYLLKVSPHAAGQPKPSSISHGVFSTFVLQSTSTVGSRISLCCSHVEGGLIMNWVLLQPYHYGSLAAAAVESFFCTVRVEFFDKLLSLQTMSVSIQYILYSGSCRIQLELLHIWMSLFFIFHFLPLSICGN